MSKKRIFSDLESIPENLLFKHILASISDGVFVINAERRFGFCNQAMATLLGRPIPANQSAPRRKMVGTTAIDSTLLTVVGAPYRPTLAGNGGFMRGWPFLPSRLSSSAVSSPQI